MTEWQNYLKAKFRLNEAEAGEQAARTDFKLAGRALAQTLAKEQGITIGTIFQNDERYRRGQWVVQDFFYSNWQEDSPTFGYGVVMLCVMKLRDGKLGTRRAEFRGSDFGRQHEHGGQKLKIVGQMELKGGETSERKED